MPNDEDTRDRVIRLETRMEAIERIGDANSEKLDQILIFLNTAKAGKAIVVSLAAIATFVFAIWPTVSGWLGLRH